VLLLSLAVCLIAYLFGSIPAGYFAGRIAGVDVRGAAPGTRETDLLHPANMVSATKIASERILRGNTL
jgi:hypothetical protein